MNKETITTMQKTEKNMERMSTDLDKLVKKMYLLNMFQGTKYVMFKFKYTCITKTSILVQWNCEAYSYMLKLSRDTSRKFMKKAFDRQIPFFSENLVKLNM